MTPADRDRRHRWAATCERLAADLAFLMPDYLEPDPTDLREIAAYLRAPREDAATKEER